MGSSRLFAIDIGASRCACGIFTAGATGRLTLQQFALETHDTGQAHDSRWLSDVAKSLAAIGARQKFRGAADISVPGHLALTKFVKTPSVAKEKRDQIVAFEAAEHIPYPLGEVVWGYEVVSDDGFDLELMLTAAKSDAMQALCATAEEAGIAVERATPAGLALRDAFHHAHPEATGSILVVNVGARSTTLLYLEGDRFFLRTLALAGNFVTQAIAEDLRIDLRAAEALKIQVLSYRSDLAADSPLRATVHRAAATFSARLALEIIRSTLNHRRRSGASEPRAMYLTGGGSLIAGLTKILGEKLRLPIERFEALRNVELSGDARAAGAEAAAPLLADLVGLAASLVRARRTEASLLPPALTASLAFRKRQPVLLAAAALAVAALLPPIVYFDRAARRTLEQVAAADSRLVPLRSLRERNEENLRQLEAAKQQISALSNAYETKSNWIVFFADLQARLIEVENVWLDRLQIVRAAAPEPGSVGSEEAVVAAPPFKLLLSGRLLDVASPQSKVSSQSLERVKQLLRKFQESHFVSAVENERFDNHQNGLLRFDFTLVVNPKQPL